MAQQARDVPIRDESIRLGQFLKLADLIDSGADARAAIADGRSPSTVMSNSDAAGSCTPATPCRSADMPPGSPLDEHACDSTPFGHALAIATRTPSPISLPSAGSPNSKLVARISRAIRSLCVRAQSSCCRWHRHHHRDPVGHVQAGRLAQLLQFADAVLGPALGLQLFGDGAVEHHQPGAVGQRGGVLRVGRHQPRAVLLGLQHGGPGGQRAVGVDDAPRPP